MRAATACSIRSTARSRPGERGVDERTFRTFLETFDLKVLESMQGLVRILHVHGTHVDMRRVLDYPCEVFSVSDRLAGDPKSLSELRTMTDKCLMGGIDETRCTTARYQSCATRFATPSDRPANADSSWRPAARAPQTPEHIWRCVRETSPDAHRFVQRF